MKKLIKSLSIALIALSMSAATFAVQVHDLVPPEDVVRDRDRLTVHDHADDAGVAVEVLRPSLTPSCRLRVRQRVGQPLDVRCVGGQLLDRRARSRTMMPRQKGCLDS